MIKVFDGNLFDSKANFIVHQVNCMGVMGSGVAAQVAKHYPNVEREYLRYCNYYKKHNMDLLGTVQYVPTESWANIMCDLILNKRVDAYDKDYQYIVNLFGQNNFGIGIQQTDLNALKKGMIDIREKAERIGASVAMPWKIGSYRGGAKWNDVYNIIKDVFKNSVINVELWRLNLG